DIPCDGLFVAIGLIPENEPFRDLADLNDYGYFDSGEDCATRTPGVFVAGDCRSKRVRQLTTALADGSAAALAACRYINEN
ncbi:MAG: FAD-dependent oxidoreductase, partial [Clostridia bacterium]|nr:FAD-dependent oxidoreductase [Clostridia bacterium]